jgi:predicted cupin superfamily sugar epimerase
MTAKEVIELFQLEPLPVEGGLFRRHYASQDTIPSHALPPRYTSHKLHASAITYMHTPETRSLLHRLKTDEIYHFYNGDPVSLVLLFPNGSSEVVVLGQDYRAGHVPFYVVPRGVWQGSALVPGGSWALMGCTMAPGFDEDDFELGVRDELVSSYPAAREWIERLTERTLK